MSLTSRLVSWLLRLLPAQTHDLVVTRDIPIPMSDDVVLLADHYAPRGNAPLPTLLVRSPYGRRGLLSLLMIVPYTERGYQVLIQSCRGTAGSGGEFVYARHEYDDGLATLEWIRQQPWFSGELATVGASYLGFVQWSTSADAGSELKAIVPQVTASDFNHFRFRGGSLNLELSLNWSTMMTETARTGPRLRSMLLTSVRERKLERAYNHLPLGEADRLVVQQSSRSFQDQLLHGPEDDYWKPVDYSTRLAEVNAPAYLMAGWYDLFLYWQLQDYQALRGRQTALFAHRPLDASRRPHCEQQDHPRNTDMAGCPCQRAAGAVARVARSPLCHGRKPLVFFRRLAATLREPALVSSGLWGLAPNTPSASEPDQYRYDPATPTPAVGGNSLGASRRIGPKDNRSLEARADVLVYTSAVLEQDMEVIGPVNTDLFVRSSLEHTDFFVRLCVAEASGKSINLCDGMLRLTPGSISPQPDGSLHLCIEVWPTAYHFRKGQRIRVQISSGAHPAFARNPGNGEPVATGTKLRVAEQTVYHDPDHPSAILLPILST